MQTTLQPIILFALYVVVQIAVMVLLPLSNAFTRPLPTAFCIAFMVGSGWCLSRLIQSGASMGILFAGAAAVMPLAAMTIGVFMGESASASKVCLLVIACGLVGVASRY